MDVWVVLAVIGKHPSERTIVDSIHLTEDGAIARVVGDLGGRLPTSFTIGDDVPLHWSTDRDDLIDRWGRWDDPKDDAPEWWCSDAENSTGYEIAMKPVSVGGGSFSYFDSDGIPLDDHSGSLCPCPICGDSKVTARRIHRISGDYLVAHCRTCDVGHVSVKMEASPKMTLDSLCTAWNWWVGRYDGMETK